MPRTIADSSQDKPRDRLRLWLQMLKTTRFVQTEIRARLRRDFATTLPRFDVMAALDAVDEGLRMSDISARLMVSNGNVTGIIDRLAHEALVMRVSIKGDRRATLVRLTPKGRRLFDDMAAAHRRWIDELLAGLSDAETAAATAVLARTRETGS
ncbi:MAG: MarR family winged helix-turn-helix transcriptional regulator [Paracoccaceae bacterium]